MGYLTRRFKNTKIEHLIRRSQALKRTAKGIYKLTMFPFTRRGVNVAIGGFKTYKLDYNFALRDYESFGDRHNSGFRKWIEYCRGKAVVFDIGAHIGLYTLPASSVIAPEGMIYAFEPSQANRLYLKRHLRLNGIRNVVLCPYVVGERTKEKQLFYEQRGTDPMNSLYPKKNRDLYSPVFREQMSLDDFGIRAGTAPDVIKIDVEGSECNVLKGARSIINKHHPFIFLSVHPGQLSLFNSSVDELRNILNGLRYIARDWAEKEVKSFEKKEYLLTPA